MSVRQQRHHLRRPPAPAAPGRTRRGTCRSTRAHLPRAEREGAGEPAAGVDVGGQGGVVGHGPDPTVVPVTRLATQAPRHRADDLHADVRAGVRTQSVNLGQGFPDVDGPPEVIAEAVAALEHGHNQYAPGPGRPRAAPGDRPAPAAALRDRARPGLARSWSRPAAPRGSRPRCSGLVDPGDEVVVLEPYYDCYVAMIQMAGGVRRPVTLRAPDFRLDVDDAPGGGHAADPVRAAQLARTTRPAPCSPARSSRRSPTWRSSTTSW